VQIQAHGAPPQAISVDDATGAVRAPRDAPPADPISAMVRKVHAGDDMPEIWRWIITVVGVAPTLLGVTGIVLWLRRPRAARAKVKV
jgi:hypothetical protein